MIFIITRDNSTMPRPKRVPTSQPSEASSVENPAATKELPFSPSQQWVKLVQRGVLQLVDERCDGKKVSLRMLKIYLVLLAHMDSRNYVRKCQKDLADILGISPQAFSAGLRELEELGHLVRIGGRDKSRKIMLSPYLVSMGTLHDSVAVTGEFQRQRQEKRR